MKSLIASLLLLPAILCHAGEVDNARLVTVRAKLETSRNDAKRERTETVGYNVNIELRGAKSVAGKLKVVTIIFAKKYPGNGISEKESTDNITLNDNKEATLSSSTESLTFTEEYSVRIKPKKKNNGNNNGNKKKAPVRYKKVPAVGERYSGWAVRVYQGNKLLGEEASSSHLLLDQ
ncbi:MAG: hypothetical protein ABJQ29_08200 [Luteolibacter sp.]